MKLNINLENYKGNRGDTITIDIKSMDEIPKIYQDLQQLQTSISKQLKDLKLAFYKNGKPVLDKNNRQLNTMQYEKYLASDSQKRVWDLTLKDIEKLEVQ